MAQKLSTISRLPCRFLNSLESISQLVVAWCSLHQLPCLCGKVSQFLCAGLACSREAFERLHLADGTTIFEHLDLLFGGSQLVLASGNLLLDVLERLAGQFDLALQIGLLRITFEFFTTQRDFRQLVLKLEFVLGGFCNRCKTALENGFLLPIQVTQLLREVFLRV